MAKFFFNLRLGGWATRIKREKNMLGRFGFEKIENVKNETAWMPKFFTFLILI